MLKKYHSRKIQNGLFKNGFHYSESKREFKSRPSNPQIESVNPNIRMRSSKLPSFCYKNDSCPTESQNMLRKQKRK